MSDTARWKNIAVGLLGALAGGLLGYFGFAWACRQGLYAMVLPGAMLGLGAGLWVRDRSILRAVLCGIAALALSLFAEWQFAPFSDDQSLAYFLMHLHQLRGLTMIMVAAGSASAFWLSLGKNKT
jgi:hypothetical protein